MVKGYVGIAKVNDCLCECECVFVRKDNVGGKKDGENNFLGKPRGEAPLYHDSALKLPFAPLWSHT